MAIAQPIRTSLVWSGTIGWPLCNIGQQNKKIYLSQSLAHASPHASINARYSNVKRDAWKLFMATWTFSNVDLLSPRWYACFLVVDCTWKSQSRVRTKIKDMEIWVSSRGHHGEDGIEEFVINLTVNVEGFMRRCFQLADLVRPWHVHFCLTA